MEIVTLRNLEFEILRVLSKTNHEHTMAIIGRPYQRGLIESKIGRNFQAEERVLADRAFEALKAGNLIRATYGDLTNPELWVEITESGRESLKKGTLDKLAVLNKSKTSQMSHVFG